MKARLYDPQDYDTIAGWWNVHGVPVLDRSILPPLGVVIEDEEKVMMGAVWIYLALNVGVGFFGWWVTNPTNTPKQSVRVLNMLADAGQVAMPEEYNLVVAVPYQESLKRLLQKQGFNVAHTCTEMMKFIPRPCPLSR